MRRDMLLRNRTMVTSICCREDFGLGWQLKLTVRTRVRFEMQ